MILPHKFKFNLPEGNIVYKAKLRKCGSKFVITWKVLGNPALACICEVDDVRQLLESGAWIIQEEFTDVVLKPKKKKKGVNI